VAARMLARITPPSHLLTPSVEDSVTDIRSRVPDMQSAQVPRPASCLNSLIALALKLCPQSSSPIALTFRVDMNAELEFCYSGDQASGCNGRCDNLAALRLVPLFPLRRPAPFR
jgi:hypothetical protein